MGLVRHLAANFDWWGTLFNGDMRRLLEMHKRFADPTTCEQVLWLTGDATLQTVSLINWQKKEFLKANAEDLLRNFNGANTVPPIIADVELIAGVAGVIIWDGVKRDGKYDRPIVVVGTEIETFLRG